MFDLMFFFLHWQRNFDNSYYIFVFLFAFQINTFTIGCAVWQKERRKQKHLTHWRVLFLEHWTVIFRRLDCVEKVVPEIWDSVLDCGNSFYFCSPFSFYVHSFHVNVLKTKRKKCEIRFGSCNFRKSKQTMTKKINSWECCFCCQWWEISINSLKALLWRKSKLNIKWTANWHWVLCVCSENSVIKLNFRIERALAAGMSKTMHILSKFIEILWILYRLGQCLIGRNYHVVDGNWNVL